MPQTEPITCLLFYDQPSIHNLARYFGSGSSAEPHSVPYSLVYLGSAPVENLSALQRLMKWEQDSDFAMEPSDWFAFLVFKLIEI